MDMAKLFRAAAVVGLTAGIAVGLSAGAEAQERVKWKMPSAFGSKLSILGPTAKRFTNSVKVMSGGTLILKFYEPGALVPALEMFDSVSKGAIDSAWTTPGYHIGKIPALAFYSAVPFGPGATEYLGWFKFGGGTDLLNEIYAKYDLYSQRCLAIAPEASGWFRKEMKSVADFKGLKMRFFGMGALVMNKLGVSTQLLAGADIYPALERGVIDATDAVLASIAEEVLYPAGATVFEEGQPADGLYVIIRGRLALTRPRPKLGAANGLPRPSDSNRLGVPHPRDRSVWAYRPRRSGILRTPEHFLAFP